MVKQEGRIERYRQEQETRRKAINITYTAVLSLFLVAGLLMVISVVYLYRNTKQWGSSQTKVQMANIEPVYVSDYPDLSSQAFVEMSNKVNITIKEIETNHKLPSNVNDVVGAANDFTKKHNITSGQLVDDIERLSTYVSYYHFIDTSITNPDVNKLKELHATLSSYVLANKREFDGQLLDNLNKLVNDYDQLHQFITQTVPTYGEIKDGHFIVPASVTQLDTLLSEANKLLHFPTVKSFADLLTKAKNAIVTNNMEHSKHLSYVEFKTLIGKLDGLYIQRSSVKTYEDVIKNGWTVEGEHKPTDKVLDIIYHEHKLEPTEWIRMDAKPEITFEETKAPTTPVTTTTSTTTHATTSTSTNTTTSTTTHP